MEWMEIIPEWLTALATVLGAAGTILACLGYRKRGRKLSAASEAIEEAGRRIVDAEDIIRALVIAIEKFRADIKTGRHGAAARNLPDIARLIQAFAEELGVESDLSGYVQANT